MKDRGVTHKDPESYQDVVKEVMDDAADAIDTHVRAAAVAAADMLVSPPPPLAARGLQATAGLRVRRAAAAVAGSAGHPGQACRCAFGFAFVRVRKDMSMCARCEFRVCMCPHT